MDTPILKMHWERFKAHIDLDRATATRLLAAYTADAIDALFLLSEGCANTNYKVTFKNNRSPVLIRIYTREKSALLREIAIYKLIANNIPAPAHLYFNDQCTLYPHPYAVMEWVDGILMREVILKKNKHAIMACAFEAGHYLNIMRQIKFPYGGFFQNELDIRPFNDEEKYLPFVLNLLQDKIVKESLGETLLSTVSSLIHAQAMLLPESHDANLTHADYDPANILVTRVGEQWKIAAILDWEFSFAGTYLLDMGMMLRYSHKLPDYYEKSFIAGIQANGFQLPPHWKKQAKLMDLLCLLQLTHYNPVRERPKLNRDVVSLIADTVNDWDFF